MALPDSIPTLPSPLTFERLDIGRWIRSDSTVDQPIVLSAKSTVNPDGISDFVLRVDQSVNSPTLGLPDSKLSVYLVCRYDTKTFHQGFISAAELMIHDAITRTNYLQRLMRGER